MLKRIIDNNIIKQIIESIDNSEQIVITCHKSPDGDAIGSSLGLAHTLDSIGKTARVVTPDRPPKSLKSLPDIKSVVPYSQQPELAAELLSTADLIFCLDFNDLNRVDRMRGALENSSAKKILIDHHRHPGNFADITISQPEQSSTSVLLYRLLNQMGLGKNIGKKAAACIYTGMMTDTGNFSFNSNDPELYLIIAELLKRGIDKDEIYKKVMNTKSANVLKLHSFAIAEKMQIFPELQTALIILTSDELNRFDYQPGDDESLVNQPLAIEGIVYSVYLRQDSHQIKVSTRSVGDFRADLLCNNFYNGGGHVNAAGGELHCSLEEAVEVFNSTKSTIKEYLINPPKVNND
ncbi:MAG: bifunctional oligoribonuclease/PAP phosphatase NrnA [Muribaculum sp.]|nr:bifunctional oligoribonuclease/PAP phosphatase NrnA [Muribaculaceae bacterium]MCM1080579.1 bifunctional oligoribonuclease/PAP phosphatase NrnA [Muribaculum sp.]